MQMNRLFEIVYVLMNKKSVTAGELAERFGVSQRTIYRDIDILSLAGIPLYTSKGKGGGIRMIENFVLDTFFLSDKDQNAILTALQGLAAVRTEDSAEVLGKLSALFNKNVTGWLDVDFSDWSFSNGELFNILKTAILEHHVVEFDYFSTFGECTRRRVEPGQLWFKHRAWYLKGFCLTRNDMRVFKLARMRDVAMCEELFEPRDWGVCAEVPRPDVSHIKKVVALKMRIAPEMTYRVYDEFGDDQIVKKADGSFEVSVCWDEDDWVYGFLLSFGESLEVLEPPHIRDVIREKALQMAEKYRDRYM